MALIPPARTENGETFLQLLEDVDVERFIALREKMAAAEAAGEMDAVSDPNHIWMTLWRDYRMREELSITDIVDFKAKKRTLEEIYAGHETALCSDFAQALLNTPVVGEPIAGEEAKARACRAESDGIARSGWHRLANTLANYHLDLMPYICDTQPLTVARVEEVVENRFGLLKNSAGAESNLEFYGYVRAGEIVKKTVELRDRLIRGIEQTQNQEPLDEDALTVACSLKSWLEIHKEHNRDLYLFAGELRQVNLSKFSNWNSRCYDPDDPNIDWKRVEKEIDEGAVFARFCDYEEAETHSREALTSLDGLLYDADRRPVLPHYEGSAYDHETQEGRWRCFARAVAEPFLEINAVHPSREGTSLVNQIFFWALGYERGIDFKWKYQDLTAFPRLDAVLAYEESGRTDPSMMEEYIFRCIECQHKIEEIASDEKTAYAWHKQLRKDPVIAQMAEAHHPDLSKGATFLYGRILQRGYVEEKEIRWLEDMFKGDEQKPREPDILEMEWLWSLQQQTDAMHNAAEWDTFFLLMNAQFLTGQNEASAAFREHLGEPLKHSALPALESLGQSGAAIIPERYAQLQEIAEKTRQHTSLATQEAQIS